MANETDTTTTKPGSTDTDTTGPTQQGGKDPELPTTPG